MDPKIISVKNPVPSAWIKNPTGIKWADEKY
jgi:hypothetical protein